MWHSKKILKNFKKSLVACLSCLCRFNRKVKEEKLAFACNDLASVPRQRLQTSEYIVASEMIYSSHRIACPYLFIGIKKDLPWHNLIFVKALFQLYHKPFTLVSGT